MPKHLVFKRKSFIKKSTRIARFKRLMHVFVFNLKKSINQLLAKMGY